jgi:hypothetical protein
MTGKKNLGSDLIRPVGEIKLELTVDRVRVFWGEWFRMGS